MDDEPASDSERALVAFKDVISAYSCTRSSSESPIKPTEGRRHIAHKRSASVAFEAGTSSTPPRRTAQKTKTRLVVQPEERVKVKRTAHIIHADLLPLSDHLATELDVMFCGINPGRMSAQLEHHFANPTNHFWKCLHRSKMTPRQLSPMEDYTLPSLYNYGLTNLVERPSRNQSELASSELTSGVPALLAKIRRLRPRVVCFVGMDIAEKFRAALVRAPGSPLVLPVKETGPETDALGETVPSQHVPAKSSGKMKSKTAASQGQARAKAHTGMQSYKVVHPASPDVTVKETLFFVMPSTSGLVSHYQLPQKVEFLVLLKRYVEKLKEGLLDTNDLAVIPPSS